MSPKRPAAAWRPVLPARLATWGAAFGPEPPCSCEESPPMGLIVDTGLNVVCPIHRQNLHANDAPTPFL